MGGVEGGEGGRTQSNLMCIEPCRLTTEGGTPTGLLMGGAREGA